MDDWTHERTKRIRAGWLLGAVGGCLLLSGITLELLPTGPDWASLVTAAGILVAGAGIGLILQYRALGRSDLAGRRAMAEQFDERAVQLRQRAGNRAWWTAAGLIWLSLMWSSLAAIGRLPDLSGDRLWNVLVACLVIPFAVYLGSFLVEQRNR